MPLDSLILFLLITGLASYFQTITGFGMGLIVIGAASIVHLASVPTLAAVVSFLSLGNGALALRGRMHHIDWPAMKAAALGIFPAMIGGVLLLEYLSDFAAGLLRLFLGVAIALSGAVFAIQPTPRVVRSTNAGFAFSGALGGLLSGLFGIAGPPLILHFYRQPLSLSTVRYTLMLVFVVSAVGRTIFVFMQGHLIAEVWMLSALALPAMAIGTLIGRHYPPQFSAKTVRRIVFLLLTGIGASLVISVIKEFAPTSAFSITG